jgi:uncharacterized membrane protein
MAISLVLVLAFLIGVVCGLRSMTGPALVCWAAHLGWFSLEGSHLAFLGNLTPVIIFSVFAAGEIVADKLPKVPSRISIGPLVWRVLMGGMCGAAMAIAGEASAGVGCLLGGLGAAIGAYAGYTARRVASCDGLRPDFPAALFEDLVAVGGGLFLVSRF